MPEISLEQAWGQFDFAAKHGVRAGIVLPPLGRFNILHDDDWVEPGYYRAIRAVIESEPSAGSAFCQHTIVDRGAAETTTWHSWVERETPGIVAGWLDRIALECRVQFSSMSVRRDTWEAVGGFCADAASAFERNANTPARNIEPDRDPPSASPPSKPNRVRRKEANLLSPTYSHL